MYELKCDDIVKELWHGVCREVIMSRLLYKTKVCMCYIV